MLVLLGCAAGSGNLEQFKQEILETEKSFAEMASQDGVEYAFLHFAAEDAVLNRADEIIQGKKAIKEYFEEQTLQDVKLDWSPDFVDVAASGDLAYTYGKYTFSAIDEAGNKITAKGVFHTVWKRQSDGSWKYVYD